MNRGYGARTQNYEEWLKDHKYYEENKSLKGRTPKQRAEEIKKYNNKIEEMNKSNNGKAISKHLAEYSKTHNEQEIRTELENNSELYDKQLREFSGKAKASFGKINYGGKGKRNEATVEFKLDKGNFTASGNIWNSKGTDILSGGQNLDEMKKYINDPDFNELYDLHSKYHLNDMHAGTVRQEEALEKKFGGVNASRYTEQVEYLKSIGLYEDEGYKYGTGWLKREIPTKDLNRIKKLIDKYSK